MAKGIPISIKGFLADIRNLLIRLVGGFISIERLQISENDFSWYSSKSMLIRFSNFGQSTVIIDEQIILNPGESYVEGDTAGPGIDHMYEIRFVDLGSMPQPDGIKVIDGNLLQIRTMRRNYKN